jgi:acetyltransferase
MIRPIRDEDPPRLQAFHLGLSSETLYLRFGHLLAGFPNALATWLTCVDGDQRMAFVATDPVEEVARAPHPIIGIARYEHVRPRVAEMAEVVADQWQGRGLGPQLLYRLAVYACSRGYTTLIGFVRSTNARMVRALRRGALPYTLKPLDEDTVLATIDVTHAGAPRAPWSGGSGVR